MTAKKGDTAGDAENRERLEVEFLLSNLKLEMMENWKKRVRDADLKAFTSLLEVAGANGELRKVALKRNKLEGRLGEVEAESDRRLTCLNTVLVK